MWQFIVCVILYYLSRKAPAAVFGILGFAGLLLGLLTSETTKVPGRGKVGAFCWELPAFFRRYWKHAFRFNGRASAREFWVAQWAVCALFFVAAGVLFVLRQRLPGSETFFKTLFGACAGILLFPELSLFRRRLRDTGDSPVCLLWILVPFYGYYKLLMVFIKPSFDEKEQKLFAMCRETAQKDRENQERRMAQEKKQEQRKRGFWHAVVQRADLPASMQSFLLYHAAIREFYVPEKSGKPESVFVTNDERVEKIDEMIRRSGVFSGRALPSPKGRYDAPCLRTLYERYSDKKQRNVLSEYLGRGELSSAPAATCFEGKVDASKQSYLSMVGYQEEAQQFSNVETRLDGIFRDYVLEYWNEYEVARLGLDGEAAVQDVLAMHEGAFIVLHNLRLEFPNQTDKPDSVEIDTLVLAPNGIFAIEVKNYGARGQYRIVVGADGQWYKQLPGQEMTTMKNPFEQNDRHVAFLERFVNQVLERDMMHRIHVENIIVLANNNVQLVSDPNARQTLTRVGTLYHQLTLVPEQKLTLEELKKVEAAFQQAGRPANRYPLADYASQMNEIVNAYKRCLKTQAQMMPAVVEVLNEMDSLDDWTEREGNASESGAVKA